MTQKKYVIRPCIFRIYPKEFFKNLYPETEQQTPSSINKKIIFFLNLIMLIQSNTDEYFQKWDIAFKDFYEIISYSLARLIV